MFFADSTEKHLPSESTNLGGKRKEQKLPASLLRVYHQLQKGGKANKLANDYGMYNYLLKPSNKPEDAEFDKLKQQHYSGVTKKTSRGLYGDNYNNNEDSFDLFVKQLLK